MTPTVEDLVGALDGTVDGMPIYQGDAPDGMKMPYLTYDMKLVRTIYAGDEPMLRFWRYDVHIWQHVFRKQTVAMVLDALSAAGIGGNAFAYPDDEEQDTYTTVETTVTEKG